MGPMVGLYAFIPPILMGIVAMICGVSVGEAIEGRNKTQIVGSIIIACTAIITFAAVTLSSAGII